jgi:hypothetical protein
MHSCHKGVCPLRTWYSTVQKEESTQVDKFKETDGF